MGQTELTDESRKELQQLVRQFRRDLFEFYNVGRGSPLGKAIQQAYIQAGEVERHSLTQEQGQALVGHTAGKG